MIGRILPILYSLPTIREKSEERFSKVHWPIRLLIAPRNLRLYISYLSFSILLCASSETNILPTIDVMELSHEFWGSCCFTTIYFRQNSWRPLEITWKKYILIWRVILLDSIWEIDFYKALQTLNGLVIFKFLVLWHLGFVWPILSLCSTNYTGTQFTQTLGFFQAKESQTFSTANSTLVQ